MRTHRHAITLIRANDKFATNTILECVVSSFRALPREQGGLTNVGGKFGLSGRKTSCLPVTPQPSIPGPLPAGQHTKDNHIFLCSIFCAQMQCMHARNGQNVTRRLCIVPWSSKLRCTCCYLFLAVVTRCIYAVYPVLSRSSERPHGSFVVAQALNYQRDQAKGRRGGEKKLRKHGPLGPYAHLRTGNVL
jgi:hypothetical protein